jgi:hypothetical protein
VPQTRSRLAERALLCALSTALSAVPTMAGAAQPPTGTTAPSPPPPVGLRTFELVKPPDALVDQEASLIHRQPTITPAARERLRTMIGAGYVQGADWGSEILAAGSVAGAQVQLNALATSGREGLLLDQGSVSIFDPVRKWRVDAGDVFSQLRGAAVGGRFSWAASGNRRPAVAVYAPRRAAPDRRTVVSYRDQLVIRGQQLVDAEVASDRSYFLRSRLTVSRIDLEASHRSQRGPSRSRDNSIAAGLTLWRGVSLNGALLTSVQRGESNDWRMLAVRFPLAPFVDLTLERAFASSGDTANTTTAVMSSMNAGDFRLFHRYQHGAYDIDRLGLTQTLERQQNRSMTSYSPNARLNLTLQLATQRTDTGHVEHWEELQTTLKLTSTTTLRAVTAVPDLRNAKRFQGYIRQELPGRFALQADYGRISAFQSVARELDRSRLKVMLFKTLDFATPAGGATVAGRVLDHSGGAVAGARVKLGRYTADSGTDGGYRFSHVPAGEYELGLEPHLLPADFAWDGRRHPVVLRSTASVRADLKVTPLNAIHGRVYADRNSNGRFDSGEAVAGAAIRVGDRLTASDRDGGYSFYNLWPGPYLVELQSVPMGFDKNIPPKSVILSDGGPVTGADLIIVAKDKPIVWDGGGK